MKKTSCLFCYLLLLALKLNSQTDSATTQGTIKIVSAKKQIYIKAYAKYDMYKSTAPTPSNSYGDFIKSASLVGKTPPDQQTPPVPAFVEAEEVFSYTNYFNRFPELKNISLGEKSMDTVVLRIEVNKSGKYQYFHTNRKNVETINLDSNVLSFRYSDAELACMAALKEIKKWKPAHQFIPQYVTNRKNKKKSIKFNKEMLNADGTVVIVFSTSPFE